MSNINRMTDGIGKVPKAFEPGGTIDETNAAEYVETAMRGRLDDIADLLKLADGGDPDYSVSDERAEDLGLDHGDFLGDQAQDRLYEYPLGVEATTTFEIVLGTGGPDSRLLIECDVVDSRVIERGENVLASTGYEIRRILFQYSWQGQGEIVLVEGTRDFAAAESFARRVVPELSE